MGNFWEKLGKVEDKLRKLEVDHLRAVTENYELKKKLKIQKNKTSLLEEKLGDFKEKMVIVLEQAKTLEKEHQDDMDVLTEFLQSMGVSDGLDDPLDRIMVLTEALIDTLQKKAN